MEQTRTHGDSRKRRKGADPQKLHLHFYFSPLPLKLWNSTHPPAFSFNGGPPSVFPLSRERACRGTAALDFFLSSHLPS